MLRFWYHLVPFALLGIFSLTELGLTGEWVNASLYSNGRVGFALFVSIWTFLSLLAHWTFPFILAGAWAAFTVLLWFIAAIVLSASSCINVDVGFGRTTRVCLNGYSRWNAMVAFAWINFIIMLAILACVWWYVMKTKELTWRHGIYGRNYYFKPSDQGIRGTDMSMKETSPTRAENA